jgi:hypothetical protein
VQEETESGRTGHFPLSNGTDVDTVSIDEVQSRFLGEWVLMRVTRFGEYGVPLSGKVIAHSPDREEVSKALPPRLEAPGPSDGPYYVFLAEPRSHSGPEFEQAALEALDQINARLDTRRRGVA